MQDVSLEEKLIVAAINGDVEKIKALIENGVKIDTAIIQGLTPLQFAIESNKIKLAKMLNKHGANIISKLE